MSNLNAFLGGLNSEMFIDEVTEALNSDGIPRRTYQGYECGSLVNGDGIRTVVWFSGCVHHCKGCHNPDTWNPKSGKVTLEDMLSNIAKSMQDEFVSGITLSGGDPCHPMNIYEATVLSEAIKKYFPEKTIWVYTGYKWEELIEPCHNIDEYMFTDIEMRRIYGRRLLKNIDVLVDGKFNQGLADINYPWAGSTNQRVIDVKESLKNDKIILH